MVIGSATQERAGLVARSWGGLMAKLADAAERAKKLGQDDPRRLTHSLKVGLALTLVSLLYYFRPLYDGFGASGMWAVLTVVVVFEFTVGATLCKCLNRGFATLTAGALGVGAQHLASLSGEKGEPILLGIFVFLLAAASTFLRFFPRIKARYDYGVVIFILTFSLVSVSGVRVDKILELAQQRLMTIIFGGATCMIISIVVCPVWAGEDLHKLVAFNVEKLARYLEGFGGEYFQFSENGEGSGVISKDDKSFLQEYKSVLDSKSTKENLANFARWEPGHGHFRFRHPWKQYLKIGALSRQCACQIEALNGYIYSDIQAPQEFKRKIQESCTKMSSESSKALKALSSAIQTMTDPSSANPHVENSKNAIKDLKITLKAASLERELDLLAITPAATVSSILIEIVNCVEKIAESVRELSCLLDFKGVEPTVAPEKPMILNRGSVKPVLDGDSDPVTIIVHGKSTELCQNKNPHAPKRDRRIEV